jgi:hypothetical protein
MTTQPSQELLGDKSESLGLNPCPAILCSSPAHVNNSVTCADKKPLTKERGEAPSHAHTSEPVAALTMQSHH